MWMDLGISFGQIFNQSVKGKQKSISGIFHEQRVVGAGFNLLVNRTEEEDEREEIEPLDWLNCAADKANATEGEVCGNRQLCKTQLVRVNGSNAIEPLDWYNCAADTANAAEDEAVMMIHFLKPNLSMHRASIFTKL